MKIIVPMIKIIVFGSIPIFLILLFSSNFFYCYQLTDNSFDEIKEINKKISALSIISSIKFDSKDTLMYEVYELIEPKFFKTFPSIQNKLINSKEITIYKLDTIQVKSLISKDKQNEIIKLLDNNKINDIDSAKNILGKVIPDSLITWLMLEPKRKEVYCISSLTSLMLSDSIFSRLNAIKNKNFDTHEDFIRQCQKTIGIEATRNFENTLDEVIEHYPLWWKRVMYVLGGLSLFSVVILIIVNFTQEIEEDNKKIKESNDRTKTLLLSKNGENITWEVAYSTLDEYYRQNIRNIKKIFLVSVIIMVVAFGFIVAMFTPFLNLGINSQIVGATAGVICEFIGATFLYMYKTTLKQSIHFTTSLERINNVCMSKDMIDSISLDESNKADICKAKIEIAKMLITHIPSNLEKDNNKK